MHGKWGVWDGGSGGGNSTLLGGGETEGREGSGRLEREDAILFPPSKHYSSTYCYSGTVQLAIFVSRARS